MKLELASIEDLEVGTKVYNTERVCLGEVCLVTTSKGTSKGYAAFQGWAMRPTGVTLPTCLVWVETQLTFADLKPGDRFRWVSGTIVCRKLRGGPLYTNEDDWSLEEGHSDGHVALMEEES